MSSYQYNASNELTSNSGGSFTYDANGKTLTDPSGKSYAWDVDKPGWCKRLYPAARRLASGTIPSKDESRNPARRAGQHQLPL
jgi:hypothetical protein